MKARHALRAGTLAALAGALIALGGCHTAGSMLVEVDVYKGPLTRSKTVQLGEIVAIFDEAAPLLDQVRRDAARYAAVCPRASDPIGCELLDGMLRRADALQQRLRGFREAYTDDRVRKLTGIADAFGAGQRRPTAGDRAEINEATQRATAIATQLKVEAFYWSEAQIGAMPSQPTVRYLLVGFTNLVSELSNQIASRTDALIKQLNRGVEGTDLALSDHLKDAGPTDFLHLYDWYQATLPDALTTGPERLTPQDRARLARRLFSDHYWTRINEVHASGQGEVRMALIKDDIGNWNLKSFDSDAERLLDAYRNLTFAGIETAIGVGKAVAAGGGAGALDVASQLARGRFGSTQAASVSASRIDAMRDRARAEIEAVRKVADEEGPALVQAEDAARAALEQQQQRRRAAQGAYEQAVERRTVQEQQVARLRQPGVPEAALSPELERLQALREDEERLRVELVRARDEEGAARTEFDTASSRHRDVMAGLVAEARKALEVHRRVIDGLKEMQGAAATQSGGARVPGADALDRAARGLAPQGRVLAR